MNSKICLACGELFPIRPQNPTQSYCSKKSCQLKRRVRWQKNKLQTDPDYRDNQMRAQQAWMERNTSYWRKYRDSHPTYIKHNRTLQRQRNNKADKEVIAKMDVSAHGEFPSAGIYLLVTHGQKKIAKMDVWMVELTRINV